MKLKTAGASPIFLITNIFSTGIFTGANGKNISSGISNKALGPIAGREFQSKTKKIFPYFKKIKLTYQIWARKKHLRLFQI